MATLYLVEQNTILRKSGDRLLVCAKPPGASVKPGVRQSDIILELPCEDVNHVMIFGNIQLTTQAMHQLLRHGIETAIFSTHGELLGQITPPAAKNILLRKAQYHKYDDSEFRLNFSRHLVQQKIKYSMSLLKEFRHNHPKLDVEMEMKMLDKASINALAAKNLKSLLGIEGSASASYFKVLGKMLPSKWQFSGRTRRPPKDPSNAVLSFGYTIVTSELRAMLDGVGFDPYLGFYHEIDYGRPSLALDLVEIFRHSFIDRLALKLFNLNILNENDFSNVAQNGIYLANSGKIKFFKQYEKMAGTYMSDDNPQASGKGFRKEFQKQVQNLADTLTKNTQFELVFPQVNQ